MQAEFRAPRRRPRVHEAYEAPLPVIHSRGETLELRAQLFHQHVLVCQRDHIRKIHNQGYFGKGILSRARPDYSISDQWEQHEGLVLPVVSQSRYEERIRWAGAALSAQGLDEEAVGQILRRLSQPVDIEEARRDSGQKEEPGAEGGVPLTQRSEPQDTDLHQSSDQDSEPDPVVPGPGFVLVVSDSEGDGEVREVKRSPFCLSEYLQLSLEEAFFLVYSLGCLSVHQNQEPLSIVQLWRKFRSLRPDFISSYAAYHHYRSRGWVPKEGGGAKYGVDLMLYRKGPPFYHASYSVVVERVDDAFRGSPLRRFSWRSLAALNRITANVSKELLLCYIICPTDLSEAELDSPECLGRFKVQEVIVNRWVSSKERAEHEDI